MTRINFYFILFYFFSLILTLFLFFFFLLSSDCMKKFASNKWVGLTILGGILSSGFVSTASFSYALQTFLQGQPIL